MGKRGGLPLCIGLAGALQIVKVKVILCSLEYQHRSRYGTFFNANVFHIFLLS